MDFVKIADPDKPGDYLVLAKGAFDPAVHTLFAAAPTVADAGPAAPADRPAESAPASVPSANIAELTVPQAIPLIEAAATVGALQAMQQQEAARPSPRTGVLKALQARIDTLSAQG